MGKPGTSLDMPVAVRQSLIQAEGADSGGRGREIGDIMDGKPDRELHHVGPSRGNGVTCGRGSGRWHRVTMRAVGIWDASSMCISQAVVLACQGEDQTPDLKGWGLWMVGSGAPGAR